MADPPHMVWGEASILKIAPWDRYMNRCMEGPSFQPGGTSPPGGREGAFIFFSPAKKLLVMGETVMRGPIRVIESRILNCQAATWEPPSSLFTHVPWWVHGYTHGYTYRCIVNHPWDPHGVPQGRGGVDQPPFSHPAAFLTPFPGSW